MSFSSVRHYKKEKSLIYLDMSIAIKIADGNEDWRNHSVSGITFIRHSAVVIFILPQGDSGDFVLLASQSRQSAKLFLQSSELGLPYPLSRRRVCPPALWSGGRGTLAGERGGGRVPIPTRGHALWCSLYISTL
jgi:hypothetical protein